MSPISLFCRRSLAVFRSFYATFRATQRMSQLAREQPGADWNSPETQAIARRWSWEVLSYLNVHVKVEGEPTPHPAIHVGNHLSYIDIVALYSVTHLCYVAKAEVGEWPIIGKATRLAGTLFVKRDSARSRAATGETLGEAVLNEHKKICIFPEGTTSITGRPWRKGVFHIAEEKDLWVQPMGFVYNPVRRAAYIDNDTLLFHMWKMRNNDPTQLTIKFFAPRKIKDTEVDMRDIELEIRTWVDARLQAQGFEDVQLGYTE